MDNYLKEKTINFTYLLFSLKLTSFSLLIDFLILLNYTYDKLIKYGYEETLVEIKVPIKES